MQVRQENKRAIREFECVVMHLWYVLVDLPKDRRSGAYDRTPDLLGAAATRLLREYAGRRIADRDDGFIYSEVARVPELTDNAQMAFTEWACSPEKIRYVLQNS